MAMPKKQWKFDRERKPQEPISDQEHLLRWARRIRAWIEHVNGKLQKMRDLSIPQQDVERDNVLVNRHVTRIYRPSHDEHSAFVRLSFRHPLALQEIEVSLKNADYWYGRLDEGSRAGEQLHSCIWELEEGIRATVRGMTSDTLEQAKASKPPKRPRGELNKQVKALLDTGETSSSQIAKILNARYERVYSPTSRKSVENTSAYKGRRKKIAQ
ncbi:MAG: hypothetical protein ACYSX1_10570 [Planctomycetota bacterium]|jgi:hypothetical protein